MVKTCSSIQPFSIRFRSRINILFLAILISLTTGFEAAAADKCEALFAPNTKMSRLMVSTRTFVEKLMNLYLENVLSLEEYRDSKNKLVNQKQLLKEKLSMVIYLFVLLEKILLKISAYLLFLLCFLLKD